MWWKKKYEIDRVFAAMSFIRETRVNRTESINQSIQFPSVFNV